MRNNAFAKCRNLLLLAMIASVPLACRTGEPATDEMAGESSLTHAALLTPDDMYGDWRPGSLRDQVDVPALLARGIGLGFGPCDARYDPALPAASASIVDYEINANGPFMVHAVFAYDGDDAELAMHHFVEALELSGECVAQDASETVTWSLHTLSMREQFGDEMVSYTLRSPAGDDVGPLGRLLVIRQDNLVSTVLVLAPLNDEYVTVFYDLPEAVSARMQSAFLGDLDGECDGKDCT